MSLRREARYMWSFRVFVLPEVLVKAILRSKATGLFQPNAEWLRHGF